MNKGFVKIIVRVFFVVNVFFLESTAGEVYTTNNPMNYPGKGIIEICGNISFSGSFYDDSYRLIFDFAPGINYFFINNFNIGFKPNIHSTLNHAKSYDNKLYCCIVPYFSIGYVFRVSDELLFDISPGIGFNHNNRDDRVSIVYYTLINSLKYDLGNALIILSMHYDYIDYMLENYGNDYSQIKLGIGYSLYF